MAASYRSHGNRVEYLHPPNFRRLLSNYWRSSRSSMMMQTMGMGPPQSFAAQPMSELVEEDSRKTSALPLVPKDHGPPFIPLSTLLEFAVQHTFHELTVLSELLPKKKETDRKINVVQFAHNTRALFTKLLAIVKWVKISKRFEPLSSICYFLDQHSQLFVDTADKLVHLARVELLSARMPIFQVTQAVDVLTMGTYPRLPSCIKDRFIPDPPLTAREQAQTLSRLNQIIEYRLCQQSNSLSPRVKAIRIRNGTVTLTVPGEFEVTLTLLSPRPTAKWCLLNIRVLVEDYDIGYGTKLVHPLQVHFVHQVLQAKLDTSKEPLHDVYAVLHSFAQSLQLELLFQQVSQMHNAISPNFMQVEKYDMREGVLIVSYWLTMTVTKKLTSHFRITISGEKDNPHSGLKVRHTPASPHLPVLDEDSGRLSMNRLISETVLVRCREKLLRLAKMLEMVRPLSRPLLTGDTVPSLTYPLFVNGHLNREEAVVIGMNTFFGNYVCHVPALGNRKEVTELEKNLSSGAPLETISANIDRIRVLALIERYHRAMSGIHVREISEQQLQPHVVLLKKLPADRMCFQFIRETDYYLLISFTPNERTGVDLRYDLLHSTQGKTTIIQLQPIDLIKFAPVPSMPSGSEADKVEVVDQHVMKRKLGWLGSHKELQAAMATIEDWLIFMRLQEDFDRKGIRYAPQQREPIVGGLVLKITDVSAALDVACDEFFKNLVSCSVRLDLRRGIAWPFECTMVNCPLVAEADQNRLAVEDRDKRARTIVQEIATGAHATTVSEAVAFTVVERLSIYCHLYGPVTRFAKVFEKELHKHCSVLSYTYHKLVLAYGEERNRLLVLAWKTRAYRIGERYVPRFFINFGQTMPPEDAVRDGAVEESTRVLRQWNGHQMVATLLTEQFNKDPDLVELVNFIVNTTKSFDAIYGVSPVKLRPLRAISQLLNYEHSVNMEQESVMIPIDPLSIRLTYGPYSVEFHMLEKNHVGIADACKQPTLVGLEAFWRKQAEGRPDGFERPLPEASVRVETSSEEGLEGEQAVDAPKRSPNTAVSPYPAPGSLQPQAQRPDSPSLRATLSVPSSTRMEDSFGSTSSASPSKQRTSSGSAATALKASNDVFVVDHLALTSAMTRPSESSASPFERYLYALVYLPRLGSAMDACRRAPSEPTHIPFSDVDLSGTPGSVLLTVPGIPFHAPTAPGQQPVKPPDAWTVKLRLHLCPHNFDVRLKLDFAGPNTPPELEVATFERFFDTHVSQLSEFAVMSFISLCRITSLPIFSAFARIMHTQLEPAANHTYELGLKMDSSEAHGALPRGHATEVHRTIHVNEANKNILFLLRLKPSGLARVERPVDRQEFQFVYVYAENSVKLRKPAEQQSTDEKQISTILAQAASELRGNECAIWPSISAVLERYRSAMSAA